MTESSKNKLIRVTLILFGLLMFFQPAFCEDLSEKVEVIFKGKIFGDQLMLIDNMGRKSAAKDGIYTAENGAEIRVKDGSIVDIPSSDSIGTYSSIRIIEVEYFEPD